MFNVSFCNLNFSTIKLLLIYYLLSWQLFGLYFIYLYFVCVYGQTEISVLCQCFMCDFVVILCVICPAQCHRNCVCHINIFILKRLFYFWLMTHILVRFIYYITSIQQTELAKPFLYHDNATANSFIEGNRFLFLPNRPSLMHNSPS